MIELLLEISFLIVGGSVQIAGRPLLAKLIERKEAMCSECSESLEFPGCNESERSPGPPL